ncbi:MAG: phosphoglucosamine mutase [Alphaproteobacteria bacterium]
MTRKIFGTDGVRGKANKYPMTPDMIMRLALAAGQYFTRGDHRHMVVIGKDTRLSGYMVESALTAGFTASGMNVMMVGPLPTPAIAMLTRSLRADMGVVISASHNPFEDNGIKMFGPDGYKLTDAVEQEIEAMVTGDSSPLLAQSANIGKARRLEDAPGRYIEFVKASFPRDIRLDGMKIVIDCANGAAYQIAPAVLWELGADIIPIGVDPDGLNINHNCGATAPERLRQAVISSGADAGIALDGDADRIIMVDEKGAIIDGDKLMAMIATDWQRTQRLKGDGVVATVMSNLGLERYLASQDLTLHRTSVGDRAVSAHMRQHGINIGGEQSGHIILSDHASTGDGLVAGLQVLSTMVRNNKPASEIADLYETVPQVLKNISIEGGNPLDIDSINQKILAIQDSIGSKGRLLIRKSGTEPKLRVMMEGEDTAYIEQTIDDILDIIETGKKQLNAA